MLAMDKVVSALSLHPDTVTKDATSPSSLPVNRQSTVTPGIMLVTGFSEIKASVLSSSLECVGCIKIQYNAIKQVFI